MQQRHHRMFTKNTSGVHRNETSRKYPSRTMKSCLKKVAAAVALRGAAIEDEKSFAEEFLWVKSLSPDHSHPV